MSPKLNDLQNTADQILEVKRNAVNGSLAKHDRQTIRALTKQFERQAAYALFIARNGDVLQSDIDAIRNSWKGKRS